ncbi:MAG: sensor domain-containing diguanylate cyclase [Pseudomonadota bacterium]|nr:sensor domain-containing diguanylate cyclase [Pseudomonadota bacterium]
MSDSNASATVEAEMYQLIFRLMDFVPVPLLISEEIEHADNVQRERRHVFINKAFLEQIGYTMEEMPGIQAFFELAYPEQEVRDFRFQEWLDAVDASIAQNKTVAEVTSLVRCKNGERRWFAIAAEIESNIKSEWHMVSFRDVHDIKQMLDQVEKLSHTDPLTQLANRRAGAQALEQALSLYQQTQQLFSVLLCDLDSFKEINDVFGHDCGDRILCEVAQCFAELSRDEDCVARWGGEEFLIVLPDTQLDDALTIAERLRASVNQLVCDWQGQLIMPTVSVGVAMIRPAQDIDQLIQSADRALYQAKHLGRNLVWSTEQSDSPC